MAFGNTEDTFIDRLRLLPPKQITAIEVFLKRKMKEKEEYWLIDWYVEESEPNLPPDILAGG